jgi:MMP 1-O-methyltransferase
VFGASWEKDNPDFDLDVKSTPYGNGHQVTNLDTDLIECTKGFLDPEEGRKLHDLAREVSGRGACLEIGSYCGKSSLFLGEGCRVNGGVLFSIDHHRGNEEQQPGEAYCDPELIDARTGRIDTFTTFRQTLEQADLEDTVVPIVSPSRVVARGWATPLSLVFIDGGHTFEAAFNDYNAWAGHVMPGGYLLIHDIFFDPAEGGQAPRHIYELACCSGLFEDRGVFKTLAVLQRRTGGSLPADLPA